jgi:hypothetical protein
MALKKNQYLCLLCGNFHEVGPDLCSVGFHYFEQLLLNKKKNGYEGSFQLGAVCWDCIKDFFDKGVDNPDVCIVCNKRIRASLLNRASKLAIYKYRKKGCLGVISVHDRCFRKIKNDQFPFIKMLNLKYIARVFDLIQRDKK